MSKVKLETLKKKTIKTCTFTIIVGVLACIVPGIIIKGMIDYQAKMNSAVPGAYLTAGIVAAAIIGVIVFVCVRVITGALKALKEKKRENKM